MQNREQKLIDIMFEIAMLAPKVMHDRSKEEIAEWVRYNLAECGFKTMPCGLSWGVLVNDDQFKPEYHVINTSNPVDLPKA